MWNRVQHYGECIGRVDHIGFEASAMGVFALLPQRRWRRN